MKKIDQPVDFLIGKGLLFEMNRQVLHPLGLELRLEAVPGGTETSIQLWDNRDNPGLLVFSPEQYQQGRSAYEAYISERGRQNIQKRRKMGVSVQTTPRVHHAKVERPKES